MSGWLVDLLFGTVLPRVAWISVLLSVGLLAANLAVSFGAVEYVAGLGRYLTDPANLPDEVGTAILATTASPTAGYGMLAEFRESGVLDDRATLIAVTVNTFFGFAQHIFTFYAPVLVPILGLRVGVLYVGARAAIALGITLTGILAGAVLLSPGPADPTARPDGQAASDRAPDGGEGPTESGSDSEGEPDDEPRTRSEKVREALASTGEKLRSILPRLLVVYAAVAVLIERWDAIVAFLNATTGGALPDLGAVLGSLTGAVGLPSAAPAVVGAYAVDSTTGAVVLAPLIENGAFTPRQAVATMLLGGIVSFAFSTFKRSIPFQYGIWGREFGTKVIAVNTTLKVVFIAVAVVLLLV